MKITLIMAGLLMVGLILASCGGSGSGEKGNLYYEPHDPADAFKMMVGCGIPTGMGHTIGLSLDPSEGIPMVLYQGQFVEVPWDIFLQHYYDEEVTSHISVVLYDAEIDWEVAAVATEPELVFGLSDFYGFIVRPRKEGDPYNFAWTLEVHMDEGEFMESLYAQTTPPATVQQVSLP